MSRLWCRLGIRSLKSLRFWLSLVIFLYSAFFILQLVSIYTSVSFTTKNSRELLKVVHPENRLPKVVRSLHTTVKKPFATTVAPTDEPPNDTVEYFGNHSMLETDTQRDKICKMRRTATISDTERERRHQQATAKIAPFRRLRPFTEKLFHLIDTFVGPKKTKLMDIYDQLILDLWNFYKENATYDGQLWDTWENDDDERHHHEINCTNIHQIRIGKRLGGGYIKVAYEGDFLGQKVVVKVKNMKNNNFPGVCGWENFTCAVYRDLRILNELLLMDHMDHPMISRVMGYCIHSGLGTADFLEEPGVLSVFELGEPLNFTVVRFMYWKDRVAQALMFADFLNYVEHSPFGPLTLYDLEWEQFIVTRSQICLTDMDLADNMPDPLCKDMPLHNVTTKKGVNVTTCYFAYPFNLGYVFDIPCIDGVCRQVGPKHNMHKLYWGFLIHIFFCRDCPKDLQNELASISHEVRDYMPADILVNRLKALPHGVDVAFNNDDERHHHEINCTNIHQIRIGKRLGGGYIKVAYEGDFLGQKVVVKVKNMKNNNYPGVCGWENFTCAVYRDLRILNELLLMDHMDHPMINRVLGYCIHSGLGTADYLEEPGVLSVFELGEPLNFTVVRFMYWKDRVAQALMFADFLNYVEHSPFGPLTLYDLEWYQFIVTRSQICLTDMDLADNMPDPLCKDMPLHNVTTKKGVNVTTCYFAYPFNLGYVFDIPCIDGVCRQVGPKHNMHKLYWGFLIHIFFCRDCPKDLQNELASISHEVRDYMPADILVNRLKALPHGVDVAFNSTYV